MAMEMNTTEINIWVTDEPSLAFHADFNLKYDVKKIKRFLIWLTI